ncbi:hypothetical protein BDU57DRAFT_524965 [Ampelomyces quisqualis]|uniref:Uncharacterized protein n=1 Tax=Ampelomyces quisqualis TaxID=50730 RepID=A0A6A5Q8U9_AMPQU|nr:hypothetical protein BDU57DRAFT_524965 [Ampelomyces quisqualis]
MARIGILYGSDTALNLYQFLNFVTVEYTARSISLPDDATVLGGLSSTTTIPCTHTHLPSHQNTLRTFSYAVTQHGARKIMYEHGIRNFDRGYDFALSDRCYCVTKNKGNRPLCLTCTHIIFRHFQGGGGGARSNIAGVGSNGVQEDP